MSSVPGRESVDRRHETTNIATTGNSNGALPAYTSSAWSQPRPMPSLSVPLMRGNSVSLETFSRKRPLDSTMPSPLPSPLLSYLPPPPSMSHMNSISLSSMPSSPRATRDVSSTDSLKFVLPIAAKRPRRDTMPPTSPRSVGEVNATVTQVSSTTASGYVSTANSTNVKPPTPVVAPPPSDKIRSVVRGLEHVSRCLPHGCSNPLCVSTRTFVNKVSAHLVAMAAKPAHVADKCSACQLWQSIVRTHASICMEAECSIPLCPSGTKHDAVAGGVDPKDCRRSDRRDDGGNSRFPMVALQ